MKTRKLVLCAVCAAITCVLAPIAVPAAGLVPVSFATFAVLLAGLLLGGRLGAVSQGIYLLIGAVGVPVFAGYTAGAGRLIGPTGGYLIGYIPMAFVAGALYHRFGRAKKGAVRFAVMAAAAAAGTIVLYLFGTAWYCIVTGIGVIPAMAACVLPFLPGDAIKIAAAVLIVPQLERAVGKIAEPKREKEKA